MRVAHEERLISSYLARLQKVSTYARSLSVSPVEVYRRIDGGKLEGVKIDGMQFILLPQPPASGGVGESGGDE